MQAAAGLRHWEWITSTKQIVTPRLLLFTALFFTILSAGLVVSRMSAAVAVCGAGESTLVYPDYNSRGVIMGENRICGDPHRSCVERAGEKGVFDCSPFMRP